MIKMNRKGFTLVEIMIVVAIIGLLAAIAIPNFVRARQTALKNACIANLKQIQGSIQVWAIDQGKGDTDTVVRNSDATNNVVGVVPDYLKAWPKCGASEYATPANVGTTPACPNINGNPDHVLG